MQRALFASRHIFTPSSSDLRPASPRFVPYCLLFQQRWRLREPVVVRGCRGEKADLWTPQVGGGGAGMRDGPGWG